MKSLQDPHLHQQFSKSGPGLVALDTSAAPPDQIRPVEIKVEFCKHREKLERVMKDLKINDIEAPDEIKHELIALLERCLAAFAEDDDDVGQTNLVEHTIVLRDEQTTIKQRARPVPYAVRDFVEKEIDRLLKLGIISPADPGKCPFASPIVVVSKKDATWRMCVDFRQLNDQTIKDVYPLPRIDEIFTSLHGANCFVALDLLMGYHQIAVAEIDKPKTAFITHRGLFVYNKMPFGLCNAPANFQRLMDSIYREHLGRDTTAYLDDFLSFATNFTWYSPLLKET